MLASHSDNSHLSVLSSRFIPDVHIYAFFATNHRGIDGPVIVLEFSSIERALPLREPNFIVLSIDRATYWLTTSSIKRAKPYPKAGQLQEMLKSKWLLEDPFRAYKDLW